MILFFEQTDKAGFEQGSTAERIYFIVNGWQGFLQSPLWGHGYQSFAMKFERYSHNNYIEMLYNGA